MSVAMSQTAVAIPVESITTEQLMNYFAIRPKITFPKWTLWFFIPGCLLALGSLGSNSGSGLLIAIILIGVGALGVYLRYQPLRKFDSRPIISDRQYDAWIEWQEREARIRAGKRLNLDLTVLDTPGHPAQHAQVIAEPVLISTNTDLEGQYGDYLPPTPSRPWGISVKHVSTDGSLRYRLNHFIWFFPREQILAIYESSIDAANKDLILDKTREFFYESIGSISTQQVRRDIEGLSGSVTVFTLSTNTNERVYAERPVIELHLTERDSVFEQSVKVLRELLNNQKQLRQPGGYAPGYPPGGYASPSSGAYQSGAAPGGYASPSSGAYQSGAAPGGYASPSSGAYQSGAAPGGYPPSGPPPAGYPVAPAYPSATYPPAGVLPSQPLSGQVDAMPTSPSFSPPPEVAWRAPDAAVPAVPPPSPSGTDGSDGTASAQASPGDPQQP